MPICWWGSAQISLEKWSLAMADQVPWGCPNPPLPSSSLSSSARFFSPFPIQLLPFSLNMSKKYSLSRLSATPAYFDLASAPPPHIPSTSVSLNPAHSFWFSLLVTSAFLRTPPVGSLSPLGSPPAPLGIWSSDYPWVVSLGSGGRWILATPALGCWGPWGSNPTLAFPLRTL